MASGDKEKAEITEYAGIMGMDGELIVLAKMEEQAKSQPVIAMKMISEYVTRLGIQVAQHKLLTSRTRRG
jgi:hypothetical protein